MSHVQPLKRHAEALDDLGIELSTHRRVAA